MCLFAICVSFSGEMSVKQTFCLILKIGLFAFLLMNFESSLHILNTSSLSQMGFFAF